MELLEKGAEEPAFSKRIVPFTAFLLENLRAIWCGITCAEILAASTLTMGSS